MNIRTRETRALKEYAGADSGHETRSGSDRYLSIENAKYIFNNMRNIGDEVEFKKDGIIQKRAQEVLEKTI